MNKGLKTVFIIVGVASIVLSILCFTKGAGTWVKWHDYGGDAYSGIQHAAADTAYNVKMLAKIVRFGFGSILIIIGCGLLGTAIAIPNKKDAD